MNIKNIIRISTILGIVLLMYYWQRPIHAEDIVNFDTFQKSIYTNEIKDISKIEQVRYIKYINEQKCVYTKENKESYIITPSCLFKDKLPKLWFTEAIEHMWPYITTFNTIYNEWATTFSYEWTSPLFEKKYDILPKTTTEKIQLVQAHLQGKKIRISKSNLAYQTIKTPIFM